MALDYATKYQAEIAKRFTKKSVTRGAAGNDYSFTGARGIKIYSMPSSALSDYGRGSTRYGSVSDVEYTTQEMLCTQAKSFIKHLEKLDTEDISIEATGAKFLKVEMDEQVVPTMDKYRLKKWVMGAGTLKQMAAAPTKSTIVGDIIELKSAMGDNLVPDTGLKLYITNKYYSMLLQADAVVQLNGGDYALKAVKDGSVGTFEGMSVIPVPSSYLPDGVYFVIKAPHTSADPVKLAQYDVIEKSAGYSGPIIQGLVYYDAFVIGAKNVGIGVAGSSAAVLSAATVNVSSHVASITAVQGVTFYYTEDGTDPRCSTTRKQYTSGITLTNGMTPLRIIGEKDGCVSIEKEQAYA